MVTKTEQIYELTAPWDNVYQGSFRKALFVCSAGILRSATGAYIASLKGYNARNCGTHDYALIPLSSNLIMWADVIFFMNEENFLVAKETFSLEPAIDSVMRDKAVVLNIPDIYNYRDPNLVEMLEKLIPDL